MQMVIIGWEYGNGWVTLGWEFGNEKVRVQGLKGEFWCVIMLIWKIIFHFFNKKFDNNLTVKWQWFDNDLRKKENKSTFLRDWNDNITML